MLAASVQLVIMSLSTIYQPVITALLQMAGRLRFE